jgi:2-iminobutanoate/2-iminopropanoate deaminase
VIPRSGAYDAHMSKPLGPYTPVVRAGDWIIVSGQLGMQDGALVSGGVAAQTAKAIENLSSQLASVGASLNDIAKTLCFLTDMDTFASFNEAYIAGFGDHRPARSAIGVAALPAGAAVEIEAWAYKPANPSQ